MVDDEDDLVQLFSDAVHSAGFDTISFNNPIKALEYVREYRSKISLIITDWRMPQMNGLQFIKNVSEIDKEIKVILISAYELEKDQLKEINKNDYLQKPIHMSQLIDAVKKKYIIQS